MEAELKFLEHIKKEIATAHYGEGLAFNLRGIEETIDERISQIEKLNKKTS